MQLMVRYARVKLSAAGILIIWLASGVVGTAWAEEPAADGTAERLRRLEQKAAQVETLTEHIEQLQGKVNTLQDRLSSYEQESEAMAQQRARVMREQMRQFLAEIETQESSGYGSGLGEGLDVTFWGWLTYLHMLEADRNTFWAWEVEMGLTKRFTESLAASIDVELIDTNDGAKAEIEQAFINTIISPEHETILTLGKFNAPFGIEARDFWDRPAGSTSLLFEALPHDLVGVVVTQPIADTDLTLQPFLVNGFDDDLDTNRQPSFGMTARFDATRDLDFAITNYYGPELADQVGEKLYFVLIEGRWRVARHVRLSAEYLYGTNDAPAGRQHWEGFAVITDIDVSDRWRLFGRWSYLDDHDGFVTGEPTRRQELGGGVALYLHSMVECRFEYRHDFIHSAADEDSVFGHVTFGF